MHTYKCIRWEEGRPHRTRMFGAELVARCRHNDSRLDLAVESYRTADRTSGGTCVGLRYVNASPFSSVKRIAEHRQCVTVGCAID